MALGTQVRQEWGRAGEGGNIYRSLHPESLQVLAAAPREDIALHAIFAGCKACGSPGIFSAGLSWKKGPSRLASTEGALTGDTCVKAFTRAQGLHLHFLLKDQLYVVMATNASCVMAESDVSTAAFTDDASMERTVFSNFQQTSRNFASGYLQAVTLTDLLPKMLCKAQACQISSFRF